MYRTRIYFALFLIFLLSYGKLINAKNLKSVTSIKLPVSIFNFNWGDSYEVIKNGYKHPEFSIIHTHSARFGRKRENYKHELYFQRFKSYDPAILTIVYKYNRMLNIRISTRRCGTGNDAETAKGYLSTCVKQFSRKMDVVYLKNLEILKKIYGPPKSLTDNPQTAIWEKKDFLVMLKHMKGDLKQWQVFLTIIDMSLYRS